jgi:3-dehydro-L-gulonate 2-dehydrogenase
MIDVLTAGLSGGWSVGEITASGKEYRLSQFFLCINAAYLDEGVMEDILGYTRSEEGVSYPGERTLATRLKNRKEGIPVNDKAWKTLLEL